MSVWKISRLWANDPFSFIIDLKRGTTFIEMTELTLTNHHRPLVEAACLATSLENWKSFPVWFSFHVFMRLIFTNVIMQHTSHFKWLHCRPSVAQGPSHYHHGDSRTPLWHRHNREVGYSTITSELPFSISDVTWMELFIWSCSTEASHCIETSTRATCGSYLSLRLPDMSRTCRKQRITFHSRGDLISCRHSSLAPEPGCYDKAYPRSWKWHWQITTCQCIWQCQHIWLMDTHMCTNTYIFLLYAVHVETSLLDLIRFDAVNSKAFTFSLDIESYCSLRNEV